MRQRRPSLSAQGIALLRALESERPAEQRLFYDPYARFFVHPLLMLLVRPLTLSGYGERRGPGVQGFLVARTRYIDDQLQEAIAAGIEQLVILGAGYDARAYRFAALRGRVRVFEVDHPATQRVKQRRLRPIFGRLPAHVTYVAIDFERQSLAQALAAAGYDERRKTLFIWEGVTYYISRAAVDATLAFVAGHAGAGSAIVFDYTTPEVVSGALRRGETRRMRRYRWFTGEDLRFGIAAGTLARFLAERGFEQIESVGGAELERRYFAGLGQRRAVAPVYAIARATVRRPAPVLV